MNHKHLCMIFRIVPGVYSKVVPAMLRLAVRRLADNPIAEVRFPSAEKMCQFAGMVQSREPLVDDVIWFMTAILWSITCSLRVLMEKYFCGGEFPWKLGQRCDEGKISRRSQKNG
jgi:hypothetical protein